eukprot:6819353-Ditylum_brightwellii.AAC.1
MEFMLSEEDKCRKGKHRYMWSLKLVSAAREVRYWKTRKSDALNSRESFNTLLRLDDELAICFFPMTVDKLSAKLTQARKQLKQAQQTLHNYTMTTLRKWSGFEPRTPTLTSLP